MKTNMRTLARGRKLVYNMKNIKIYHVIFSKSLLMSDKINI